MGLLEAASHAVMDRDLRDRPVTIVCDCQPATKAAVRGTGLGKLTHDILRRAGRIHAQQHRDMQSHGGAKPPGLNFHF